MAKRFTDTNKYKKPFIRGLQGAYKLLWDFLYHDCDHAGIWIVDFETAQIFIGKDMPVDKEQAIKNFNDGEDRIIEIEGGKKWFIPSFIEFQYGQLSATNRAHINIISVLKKYNLLNHNLNIIKPLASPLQGAKEKDKEMEQYKEMDKGVQGVADTPFTKTHGKTISEFEQELLTSEIAKQERCMLHKLSPQKHDEYAKKFILKIKAEEHWQDRREALRYFSNTIPYFKKEEVNQAKSLKPVGTPVEKGNRPTFEAAA